MRRLVASSLLLLTLGIVGARRSQAATTAINGYCFSNPYNTLVSCTQGTPTVTPAPQSPVKSLQVSGPSAGPFNTMSYDVRITSQLSCFALPEPTLVFAFGSPGAAVLTELYPSPGGSIGSSASVLVDQHAGTPRGGTAELSLEVDNSFVGPGGLDLKAVWPNEGVERVVNIIPPAPPTATPTPQPGAPTSTPTPTATSTPTATATPSETATPTSTPVPTPLSVRSCVQPSIVNGNTLGGDFSTLSGLTAAGAACTGAVIYLDGTSPTSFDGTTRTADSNGLVSFPWRENSTAGGGIAQVQCQLSGVSESACTGFLILQTGDGNLTNAQKLDLLNQIQGIVANQAQCSALFGS